MTRPDPSVALQKAVYTALIAADVCLTQDSDGDDVRQVFDRVPDGTPLPFCVIGQDYLEAAYDAGWHTRATVYVSVFATTLKRAKEELFKVRLALDTELNVTGFNCAMPTFEEARFIKEPDGLSEHVEVSFSYMLIPTGE